MRDFIRRSFVALFLTMIIVTSVVIVRTLTATSLQKPPYDESVPEVAEGAPDRLSESIAFKTVSDVDLEKMNLDEFERFYAWLAKTYPRTHANLKRVPLEPCSAYYVWEGRSEDNPVLLMAHTDVVPVESHELDQWTHPPFSGAQSDGFVWGRGTLDVKTGVLGIMEATETLLEAGFEPRRSIYLALGCDEEVGGSEGAERMAEVFAEQNLRFAWTLDEGHAITRGIFPGIEQPVAFVGLAEKGFVTLELEARGQGGHSSMPPPHTAVGVMSDAIVEIENHPMPARVNDPVAAMFETLAPEMGFGNRLVFRNLWLLEPIVLRILTAKKTTNATVRTTTAATVFRAGLQDNILPRKASAQVNFRIAPGDSIDEVRQHVIDAVDNPEVEVRVPARGFKSNPSPVADSEAEGYEVIARSIRSAFGTDFLVSPSLTVGGTDSRHMVEVSDHVYRFLPMILTSDDTSRIHGIDERISIENYRSAVRFYMYILRAAGT